MAYQLRPDVARVAGRLTMRVLGRRSLMALGDHLAPDEAPRQICAVTLDSAAGVLARTDHRLVYVRAGWSGSEFRELALADVSTADWESGPLTGDLTLTVAGATVQLRHLLPEEGARLLAALGPLPSAVPDAVPGRPAPPAARTDVAAELNALVEQRRAGLLTPEEFATRRDALIRRR